MTKETTNSVADLCEEARLCAASKLKAIVEACAAEACGSKTSVAHAKFVLEIAQLASASAAEKHSKTSQEKCENEDGESADEQLPRKSLAEILLDRINELRVDPVK